MVFEMKLNKHAFAFDFLVFFFFVDFDISHGWVIW